MPARCWVIVVDDGPAFGSTLAQGFCLLMPALPGGCGHRTDVVLLLGRRPKRWPSSEAALTQTNLFDFLHHTKKQQNNKKKKKNAENQETST